MLTETRTIGHKLVVPPRNPNLKLKPDQGNPFSETGDTGWVNIIT